MRRVWRPAAVVFGITMALGCTRSTPPAPVSASHQPAVVEVPDDSSPEPSPPIPASVDAEHDEPDADGQANVERIALLIPGAPLLVDVRLSLDGRPPADAVDFIVDQALAAADSDRDGRSTWKELAANGVYLAGRLSENEGAGDALLDMWLERFDANGDGGIDEHEAAAWLGRADNRPPRAFALRTSRAYSPDPRSVSRIWPLVDADDDGRLAPAEIDAAADSLLTLDANDDRVLVDAELASLGDQLAGRTTPARSRGARVTSRLAALHLEPDGDLERLDYILQDMYAPLQNLGPESFPAMPGLFAALDTDGDEQLQQSELANLRTIAPHLELSVVFQADDGATDTTAVVHVDRRADQLAFVGAEKGSRIVLAVGGVRLVLSAHDLAPTDQPADPVRNSQVRLMVHDLGDALFGELDANADGRLSEREIDGAAARLRACDADGDSHVASAELPYAMIIALLRSEPPGQQSFYVPPAPAPAADADAPEWFADSDLNQDGDVSRREFLGDAAQFARLDGNGDGFIDAAEAGEALLVERPPQRSP